MNRVVQHAGMARIWIRPTINPMWLMARALVPPVEEPVRRLTQVSLSRRETCKALLTSNLLKTPQIMYELMWDVSKFTDKSMWPDNEDPFVYSMNIG